MQELGLTERFWIQRELGRGAKSLVLDVWDALHDVRRALKVGKSPEMRDALAAEYQHLAELRHPHIVRVYDFGVSRTGLPYYSLQLIEGVHFDAVPHGRNPEILTGLALQLLEALSTLHLRGIVHRDLKPRNVMVSGDLRAPLARVLDLGFATRGGVTSGTAGTLPYMAPEAARGEAVDGRADLYALGIMLYEALVPDAASASIERVAQRHVEAPVRPDAVNPLIPRGLADVVMKLIAPDPSARYATAFDAAEALVHFSGSEYVPAVERMLRGGAVSHRPDEMRGLMTLAKRAARTKKPRVALLAGREGIGKTPLLRELGMRLGLAGFRVAHFRTTRASDTPLDRILAAAHALRPDVVAEVTSEWTRGSDPQAFARRLAMLLVDAFADAPTALFIDDVHRAEPMALRVLEQMVSGGRRAPLFMVLASDDPVPGFAGKRFELGPLGPKACGELAAHRVSGLQLPEPALERLARDGGGEPALVERTLASLLLDGLVVRKHGKYTFAGGRYSGRRSDDWTSKLEGLDERLTFVLRAAAVVGNKHIDATSLAAVARLEQAEAGNALAELARRGLLILAPRVTEPSFVFARRTLGDTIYQRMPSNVRAELHDAAAEHFAGSADEQVHHAINGTSDARAVNVAVAAGNRAAHVFADRRAIELFRVAHTRMRGVADPRTAMLATKLGASYERIGNLDEARGWYGGALVETRGRDIVTSIEASLGLGRVLLAAGDPAEAARHASAALALADESHPHLTASALRIQASVAIQAGDHGVAGERLLRANAILEEALARARSTQDVDETTHAALRLSTEVLLERARLARRQGELTRAVQLARRALQRARALGDPSAVAQASSFLARGFARAGRLDSARRALFSSLRGVRASGDRLREAGVLRELGHLRLREGRLEAALERYGNSLDIVRSLRARGHESACLTDIGFVRTLLGDWRGALVALELASQVAESSTDVRAQLMALAQLAHTQAQTGDLATASATLENVLGSPLSKTDPVLASVAGVLKAWVDVQAGETAEAEAYLSSVPTHLEKLEDPAEEAIVLGYAAQTALDLGRFEEALALAQLLRNVADSASIAYALAPMNLVLAAALHARDPRASEEPLKEALAKAVEQRTRPWEIHARLRLGMLDPGTPAAAEHLTRAMEALQSITRDLPDDATGFVLASPMARELYEAFNAERARVLS